MTFSIFGRGCLRTFFLFLKNKGEVHGLIRLASPRSLLKTAGIKAVRFIANNTQGFDCNWGYVTLTEIIYIWLFVIA